MKEQRKSERKYLTYLSRVFDREKGLLLGFLVDLTTGGALLKGSFPITVNKSSKFRIELPENFSDQAHLDVDAITVWSKPDVETGFFLTGLKLENIQTPDLLVLEQLLSNYSKSK